MDAGGSEMSEKLTIANCYKYPNAKMVEFQPELKGHYFSGKKYKNILDFLSHSTGAYGGFPYLEKIKTYKLQLRPLSSLTEEEKKKLLNYRDSHFKIYEFHEDDILKLDNFNIFIADYLRSINIDIDGFIESGKAIARLGNGIKTAQHLNI